MNYSLADAGCEKLVPRSVGSLQQNSVGVLDTQSEGQVSDVIIVL